MALAVIHLLPEVGVEFYEISVKEDEEEHHDHRNLEEDEHEHSHDYYPWAYVLVFVGYFIALIFDQVILANHHHHSPGDNLKTQES